MVEKLSFRTIIPLDQPFLYKRYASTRADEIAQTGWSEFEQENFLRQQFSAQHQFYTEQFTSAQFLIIEADKRPIGRIYIDRREDEIRLIDIALIPEMRGKGIGASLLKDLLTEAKKKNKPIRIHVERFNPALHLYERLGFKKIGDTGVYFLMEWHKKNDISADDQSE